MRQKKNVISDRKCLYLPLLIDLENIIIYFIISFTSRIDLPIRKVKYKLNFDRNDLVPIFFNDCHFNGVKFDNSLLQFRWIRSRYLVLLRGVPAEEEARSHVELHGSFLDPRQLVRRWFGVGDHP